MEILNCSYCGTVYALEHLGYTIFQTESHNLICVTCSDAQRDIQDEMLVEDDGDALASAGRGTDEDYGGIWGEYGPFGDY